MCARTSSVTIPRTAVFHVQDWGYYLVPSADSANPGATGLLVVMRTEPTDKHFDPEKMTLCVVNVQGQPERLTFERKPPAQPGIRVCVGKVHLIDRQDKQVHFFTFGGSVEATEHSEQTIYAIYSPAPIIQIFPDMQNAQDQLVWEVELDLSETQAHWAGHDKDFEHRLAALDARMLYEAVMRDLWKKYRESKVMQQTWSDFYRMLAHQVECLKEHSAWQEWGPSLEEMLATNITNGTTAMR